jgi:D-arabinose 1-dehydrogenase-like Zn-dependent alcohol dehydrogenase
MKAAVVEQIGEPLVVHSDWPDPECEAGDAVLRVEANGICMTDYHVWHGGWPWVGIQTPVPIVLGHEFCGVVEEVGAAVQGFKKGDRVVVPFNHSCGICEQCRDGHQNVCLDVRFPMFHYTGGYGRYARVSRAAVNLVPLPESISFVDAAGMGCRYMTSWHGVVDQAKVKAGEWVAVFGCGGVGLAAVNVASALGANVIAVSRTPSKLKLATELGAVATINASTDNVAGQVVELTAGGAHVSVDALGDEQTAIPALYSLRTRGRHLRLGTSSKKQGGHIPVPVDLILFKELEIIGSLGMQAARYPAMLRMVESGKIQPGKLVQGTVRIEEAGDVLASMGGSSPSGTRVINRW